MHGIFRRGSGCLWRLSVCTLILLWTSGYATSQKTESKNSRGTIPAPKPVETELEIAGYIYPGMFQREEWELVRDVRPEVRPLLGWYDEGNPDAVAWQVKWAAEAGISVLFVDWYRNRGVSLFDHWLKAFLQCENRTAVRWAVMWANHNLPGSYSVAELKAITQFWLDHYFALPEYYQINENPVVLLWDPHTIDNDLAAEAKRNGEIIPAGEGIRRALTLCRSMAQDAGYKDIHFICMYHASDLKRDELEFIANAGFNELTVYSGFGMTWGRYLKERHEEMGPFYPYVKMTEIAEQWWQECQLMNILPFIPWVPTGWDCRPRTFDREMVVTGRTPESFRKVCETAKAFCLAHNYKRIVLGPLNEWQEGSYLEPNAEYGFGMYEVLREVFAKRPQEGFTKFVRPEEVGCGPYDFPEVDLKEVTGWEFNGSTDGWYRHPCGTGRLREDLVESCVVTYRVRSDIPAMQIHVKPLETSRFRQVRVRMKLYDGQPKGDERAVFYWGSEEHPIFCNGRVQREQSVSLPVVVDGEFHDYIFPLAENPQWTGQVERFWFDPVNMSPGRAALDFIRFE
ncbi:MAG: glycoside hydrolase family 99-like domain-containing protein [Planctomycetia bacterium]|nr:glycoside hydrolase family 99-like domain-containing protein [Planctomycetia bacterium]